MRYPRESLLSFIFKEARVYKWIIFRWIKQQFSGEYHVACDGKGKKVYFWTSETSIASLEYITADNCKYQFFLQATDKSMSLKGKDYLVKQPCMLTK